MSRIKDYLSLIKFSHSIFAMPFALIGFFLGVKSLESELITEPWYLLYGRLFLLVVLCMVFARNAAMAFNRYLDRNFDVKNPRTAIREIPAGILKANNVLLFTIVNSLFFIACSFFINKLCFFLSPVALIVILGYSFTKRFTPLCHLILGLGLSLAPIGAYLSVTGAFAWLPLIFSFTVLFWVSGFDIIYALQDEEFDKENNLFSIPAAIGKTKALSVSRLLHLLTSIVIIYAGWAGEFGMFYWGGTFVFIGMLFFQHSLVKPNDLKRINLAFMTSNGIASVLFAIFVIIDLYV